MDGYGFTYGEVPPTSWETFLARTAGGGYQQSFLWGLAKLHAGYRVRRFVITARDAVLAGAQMLIRPLPGGRAIAYVPLGPVIGRDRIELARLALQHIHRIAREEKVSYLVVQPPRGQHVFDQGLPMDGFSPSLLDPAPTASLLIDLSKDLDLILSRMHKTTRYDIRASQRKGITVRAGGEEDLDTFHGLLVATSRRQHFATLEKSYLFLVWRLFSRRGQIKMLLAEFEGKVLSAVLLIAFGDTVTYWKGCWSGEHGGRYPNEALQWAAIQWAKSQGHHYYDFGGVPRALAQAVLAGENVRKQEKYRVAFYKLGFGGQVELFPEAAGYVYSPVLRKLWANVSGSTSLVTMLRTAMNTLKSRRFNLMKLQA